MRDLESTELEFVYGAGYSSSCTPCPPTSCSGGGSKGSKGKSSRKNKSTKKHKGSRKYC